MEFREIKKILMFIACSIALFANAVLILMTTLAIFLYERHWTASDWVFAAIAITSALGGNLAANEAVNRAKK